VACDHPYSPSGVSLPTFRRSIFNSSSDLGLYLNHVSLLQHAVLAGYLVYVSTLFIEAELSSETSVNL
jgi:hypothetical protein